MTTYFTNEYIQMTNKCLKIFSPSSVTRKMQNKIPIKSHSAQESGDPRGSWGLCPSQPAWLLIHQVPVSSLPQLANRLCLTLKITIHFTLALRSVDTCLPVVVGPRMSQWTLARTHTCFPHFDSILWPKALSSHSSLSWAFEGQPALLIVLLLYHFSWRERIHSSHCHTGSTMCDAHTFGWDAQLGPLSPSLGMASQQLCLCLSFLWDICLSSQPYEPKLSWFFITSFPCPCLAPLILSSQMFFNDLSRAREMPFLSTPTSWWH